MLPVVRGAAALAVVVVVFAQALAVAPPPTINPGRVAALVKKLDADSFRTRQKADQALRAMGPEVLPYIRQELAQARSFEVRHRLQRIEQHLTAGDHLLALVRLLGHSDQALQKHAAETLRVAGAPAVPLLKKELEVNLNTQHRQRVESLLSELSAGPRR